MDINLIRICGNSQQNYEDKLSKVEKKNSKFQVADKVYYIITNNKFGSEHTLNQGKKQNIDFILIVSKRKYQFSLRSP